MRAATSPGTPVVCFVALGLLACDPRSAPVVLSSVAEAPEHYDKKLLKFSGQVRGELRGEESWRGVRHSKGVGTSTPGNTMHRVVVPVVPDGWTPDQPVPLWITHPPKAVGSDGDPSTWIEQARALEQEASVGKVVDYAGREPGMRTVSAWQKAVGHAETTHGIRSDPHAPIVTWPAP